MTNKLVKQLRLWANFALYSCGCCCGCCCSCSACCCCCCCCCGL